MVLKTYVPNKDILCIADTQVHKGVPIDHLFALSKFIWEHKPTTLVHLGDAFDMPSLSSYSSKLEAEGKRLKDDLEAGFAGIDAITSYIDYKNEKGKKKRYKPKKHFLMGNHCYRIDRFVQANPCLEGYIDITGGIEQRGWEVHGFNDPLFINDVCFSHFMENSQSGRPVGGSMENKLNKFPHSFVHGHQQQYQYGCRQNLMGSPHFGVCAGSFYMHDEAYRGANNTEKRGFVYMKAYTNRYGYLDYDVEFVSLERLLAQWGK